MEPVRPCRGAAAEEHRPFDLDEEREGVCVAVDPDADDVHVRIRPRRPALRGEPESVPVRGVPVDDDPGRTGRNRGSEDRQEEHGDRDDRDDVHLPLRAFRLSREPCGPEPVREARAVRQAVRHPRSQGMEAAREPVRHAVRPRLVDEPVRPPSSPVDQTVRPTQSSGTRVVHEPVRPPSIPPFAFRDRAGHHLPCRNGTRLRFRPRRGSGRLGGRNVGLDFLRSWRREGLGLCRCWLRGRRPTGWGRRGGHRGRPLDRSGRREFVFPFQQPFDFQPTGPACLRLRKFASTRVQLRLEEPQARVPFVHLGQLLQDRDGPEEIVRLRKDRRQREQGVGVARVVEETLIDQAQDTMRRILLLLNGQPSPLPRRSDRLFLPRGDDRFLLSVRGGGAHRACACVFGLVLPSQGVEDLRLEPPRLRVSRIEVKRGVRALQGALALPHGP